MIYYFILNVTEHDLRSLKTSPIEAQNKARIYESLVMSMLDGLPNSLYLQQDESRTTQLLLFL